LSFLLEEGVASDGREEEGESAVVDLRFLVDLEEEEDLRDLRRARWVLSSMRAASWISWGGLMEMIEEGRARS
jgi:hypothetical protein